jgi:hypothetical protein
VIASHSNASGSEQCDAAPSPGLNKEAGFESNEKEQMIPSTHPNDGIADAIYGDMNPALQAKVRSILTREFYRRGLLTWDMKMALRRLLSGR